MTRPELPEVLELFEILASLRAKAMPVEAVVCRSAEIRYANESDFVSGVGAAKSGGRWNPKGIRAVYASLDILTATTEAYQNFIDYGFLPATIRPRMIAFLKVRLKSVLDLTRTAFVNALGFARTDLLAEDWWAIQDAGEESWTQAIGRGCRNVGFEGILAPSARRHVGKNVIIFPDRMQPGSRIEPIAVEDLPPRVSKRT